MPFGKRKCSEENVRVSGHRPVSRSYLHFCETGPHLPALIRIEALSCRGLLIFDFALDAPKANTLAFHFQRVVGRINDRQKAIVNLLSYLFLSISLQTSKVQENF